MTEDPRPSRGCNRKDGEKGGGLNHEGRSHSVSFLSDSRYRIGDIARGEKQKPLWPQQYIEAVLEDGQTASNGVIVMPI